MSELRPGANVELSDFFRLAAPLIVQMDDVASVACPTTAEGRRPAGERRAHRRAAGTTGRPAGSGARRNERERNRVRQVNVGFDRLRDHVPQGRRNRKLSKVDTLRAAVEYISHLKALLGYYDGDDTSPTSYITDENYLDHISAGSIDDDDVVDSWYVKRASAEASMMQLLVSQEDISRMLGDGSTSTSSVVDHRLTVDVCCSTSPLPDGSSFAGSAGYGGCATPESIDQEVTSSSGGSHLDEEAEQLLIFTPWLT